MEENDQDITAGYLKEATEIQSETQQMVKDVQARHQPAIDKVQIALKDNQAEAGRLQQTIRPLIEAGRINDAAAAKNGLLGIAIERSRLNLALEQAQQALAAEISPLLQAQKEKLEPITARFSEEFVRLINLLQEQGGRLNLISNQLTEQWQQANQVAWRGEMAVQAAAERVTDSINRAGEALSPVAMVIGQAPGSGSGSGQTTGQFTRVD